MRRSALIVCVLVAMLLSVGVVPSYGATDTEIDDAIQAGLAWMATQQQPDGRFGTGSNPVAYTAVAVLAFENEGHFPGGGNTYSTHVEKGLDFIFNYAKTTAIGLQPAGDPDTDGDGIGVSFWDESISREVYETGMVMQAIVASNTPGRVVTTGPLTGWTYSQVMQDMVDWAAFGQVDSGTGRGGWRYYANYGDSDNSTAQWPVLGLVAAEQWGLYAPQFVKDELNIWIDYVQNDANGGSGYNTPDTYVNMSKTGGLLVEMYYVGDDQFSARAQFAQQFIDSRWNDPPNGTWYGNKGHSYAMFSVFKGLELMEILAVPSAPANTETPTGDWWGDYSEYLVNTQNPDGSWPGYSYWNPWLSTGWYIVILQATVFPIEVSIDAPACACEGEEMLVTVDYSAERFEADGTLTLYDNDVPVGQVVLESFMGSADVQFSFTADIPGDHLLRAELAVTGGGIEAMAEDLATISVCETPQVLDIPDQVAPFATFDLDDYLDYGGLLPVLWSVGTVPDGWTVQIDFDDVVTVIPPAGAGDPIELTFSAAVGCCGDVVCSSSDSAIFEPNRPPVCRDAYPSIDQIWPPNHEWVPIDVLGVTDPDGDELLLTIAGIFQDEEVDTYGDGTFTPDGDGVGTATASVRAERAGTKKVPGDGRVYHIYFAADDLRGGVCEGEILVGVPHDKKDTPVDGGPLFDSTEIEIRGAGSEADAPTQQLYLPMVQ